MDIKKLESMKKKREDGFEHGLVSILPNDVPAKKMEDCKKKDLLEKNKKRDEEIITARYVNRKNPNGKLERPYLKYPGDYLTKWVFLNNEIYEIPRGLADDTNNMHRKAKKRSELLTPSGVASTSEQPADIEHEFVGVI
jgi:hypothetical protein